MIMRRRYLGLALLLCASLTTAHAAFTDVPNNAWYADFVLELQSRGVIGGNPDGSFTPNAEISRAELAKIAVHLAMQSGVITELSTEGAPEFSDVLSNAWYEEYVLLGAKSGIFSGYKNPDGTPTGMFQPQNTVTRAEALKILLLATDVPQKLEPMEPFTDVDADAWFTPYVTTAYNWGIVDGYRSAGGALTGTFGPHDPVTRAQAAKIGVLVTDPYSIKQ